MSDLITSANKIPEISVFIIDMKGQNRNALLFAALVSLTYLASPVLYVGLQTGLCKRLQASDTIANVPSMVFACMAWVPVIIAWLYPQVRLLKILMSLGYTIMSLSGVMVALLLLIGSSDDIIIGSVIVQAALLGGCNGVVSMLNWEVLKRGVSPKFRGKALGIAFGIGPLFAVIGSLFTQLMLNGHLFHWQAPEWLSTNGYPYNYSIIFGACAGCTALSAWLARYYRIPIYEKDMQKERFSIAVLGGIKTILNYPVLLIVCIAYLLVYSGNMIQNNMNIFTMESVGEAPEDLVGFQLALRFSFKMIAGFFLGWLLVRTNPKVPLLVTAGLLIAGIAWVLMVPGYWFMVAFGLMGAGELFGVYYLNYPVSCSANSQVRKNLAFLGLISSLVGFAPLLYGWISDTWNLRASFWTALCILVAAVALVVLKLPSNPKPRPQDLTADDLAED